MKARLKSDSKRSKGDMTQTNKKVIIDIHVHMDENDNTYCLHITTISVHDTKVNRCEQYRLTIQTKTNMSASHRIEKLHNYNQLKYVTKKPNCKNKNGTLGKWYTEKPKYIKMGRTHVTLNIGSSAIHNELITKNNETKMIRVNKTDISYKFHIQD